LVVIEYIVLVAIALVFLPQILVYITHTILLLNSRNKTITHVFPADEEYSDISFIMPIRKEPIDYVVEAARYVHSLGLSSYELIIVSDDDEEYKKELFNLVHKLREEGVNVWLMWRRYPRGYRTGALNDGLYASKGEYVYVLDVDTRPSKCFFERAPRVLRSDPSVVAVVGRWEPLNMNTRLSQALALGLRFLTRILYRARSINGLFTYPLGTGTLYRSKILKEYFNGWDENRIQDDMELGARIMRSGYRVLYLDECPVYVENPGTYKSFRIQQARWAYGAMDAAITRFKHIFSSNYSLIVKTDALMYLLQYVSQTLVFIGTIALTTLSFLNWFEPLALILSLTLILLMMLVIYAFLMRAESDWVKTRWEFMVLAGRLSAVSVAVSPYVAFSTLKALFRIREAYKRTPKGTYQKLHTNLRIPWELLIGIYLVIGGVCAAIHGLKLIPLWLFTTSMGYLYVVIRFPYDVFYK